MQGEKGGKKQGEKRGRLFFYLHLYIRLTILLHLQMEVVDVINDLQVAWQDAMQHGCGPSLKCFW